MDENSRHGQHRKREREEGPGPEHSDERPVKRRESNHGHNGGISGANSDDDGEGSVEGDADDYHHVGPGLGGMITNNNNVNERQISRSSASNRQAAVITKEIRFCTDVLKSVFRHKDAHPFLVPVDPVRLNVPTYFEVIKRPMDLSTIDKKLKGNEYSSAQQFKDDMKLMFDNAYQFNAPDSVVYKLAQSVQKSYNSYLVKFAKSSEKSESAKKKIALPERRESVSKWLKQPLHCFAQL